MTLSKENDAVRITDIQAESTQETADRRQKAQTILDKIKAQNGTEKNPYVIRNAGQLIAFAEAVDGGKTYVSVPRLLLSCIEPCSKR